MDRPRSDIEVFKSSPITYGAIGAGIVLLWHIFSAGMQVQETYVKNTTLLQMMDKHNQEEKDAREANLEKMKAYSDKNHDDMDRKFLASKTESAEQIGKLNATMNVMNERLSNFIALFESRSKK